jgi:hypothetical protein
MIELTKQQIEWHIQNIQNISNIDQSDKDSLIAIWQNILDSM